MAEELSTGPLTIRQSEKYEPSDDGQDWWAWAVWVDGPDDVLDRVAWVQWTLHPTFPNPTQTVTDRATKFRLDTGGWGVFPIVAHVHLKDGTRFKLRHQLQLHYPDGRANTA